MFSAIVEKSNLLLNVRTVEGASRAASMKKINDHTKYGAESTRIAVSHHVSYHVTQNVSSGHELANEKLCSAANRLIHGAAVEGARG